MNDRIHYENGMIEFQASFVQGCKVIYDETVMGKWIEGPYTQDNYVYNFKKNTIRAFGMQTGDNTQGKLIHCIRGKFIDVSIDLRRHSSSYLTWKAVTLCGSDDKILYIPGGFAHGIITLEDHTVYEYKTNRMYNADAEITFHYADPYFAIPWDKWGTGEEYIVSDRDRAAPSFLEIAEQVYAERD